MLRRPAKSSKQPLGSPSNPSIPPSPGQISHPFPVSDPHQYSPSLPLASTPSSSSSTYFPALPQTPGQDGRNAVPGGSKDGQSPGWGSGEGEEGMPRRELTTSQSMYTGGGFGFPNSRGVGQTQVGNGARSRQAGYYDQPEVVDARTTQFDRFPQPPYRSPNLPNHSHTQSIAPIPTQPPNQWRRQGLRPSASVMSLSLMRKVSPSASTDGTGELAVSPPSSTGHASPTFPMTPTSATSGECADEVRSIASTVGGAHSSGGLPSSTSMRHFALLKPGSWFGIGKGKGKSKEAGHGDGMLAPPSAPDRRARGGSSRPEAMMGLGLGMDGTMGLGMGMSGLSVESLAGSTDRERYPTIPSPGTPERRRAESLVQTRRSPARREGLGSTSPLAAEILLPPSPGFAQTRGDESSTPAGLSPSLPSGAMGTARRGGTIGSVNESGLEQVPLVPDIPRIRLGSTIQAPTTQAAFRFRSQPLSPPSMPLQEYVNDFAQSASASGSKSPSPEPPFSAWDSQESIPLPRPSGDILRSGGVSGGSGLLAASRKPWSKSVDDLGRLFGRGGAKAKVEVDAAGRAQEDSEETKDAVPTANAAKRMSWNAKQMLRDVSARDQSERTSREEERSRRTSGNFMPGVRKKTNSFSGALTSAASLSLISALAGGTDEQRPGLHERRTKGNKMSSPPALMRSGGGGLASSSSSPMLSSFAEAFDEVGQPDVPAGKTGGPVRTELMSKPVESKARAHGRTASGNLLMMPFMRHKAATQSQSPLNPTVVLPEPRRGDKLAPGASLNRLSQVIHMEGYVMRHSGSAADANKPDDYFRNAQSKAWKPYRMMLKGNLLYLYKLTPEQKLSIEGAFPTSVDRIAGKTPHDGTHRINNPQTATSRAKRTKPAKPILAIPIADSRTDIVANPSRPHLLSLVTAEGARHTLQAQSFEELETWVNTLNKTSKEAVLRRQTYLPPMGVPELKRESMTSMVDHRSIVFGVDLTRLLQQENDNANEGEERDIPWLAEACMAEIESRADETGLYRLTGSLLERKRLQQSLDYGRRVDLSINGSYPDINIITGVFKAWMVSLPDPVICAGLYYDVIAAMRISEWEQRTLAVREILRQLPRAHFSLLHRILVHLERLLEHEVENRMTPYNFAMCLAPSMLRAPGGNDVIFSDLGPACKLIMELMQYHREILGEAEETHGVGSAPPSPALPVEESGVA